ncbi:MAG: T9SS type A sorting domain-containing protein, partial [Bacteroidales bacterium]|nr:T9SS type A sorting domain-containing protein [Bacteroidales bacterium]
VDNVVFVIKGEPGEWSSLLWPHRWCIYDRYVPLHDLQVFDFNLQLEQGGYFNVSTLCHEMFHSLSAPDLYHYSDGIDPVGPWDLMCGTTEPPQQTNTYMKYKYGNWVQEIPVIEESPENFGTYELEPVSWEGGRRNGYMIPLRGSQSLFVEYRDKSNIFEDQIPGSGLLIYRIDTRFDGNASWNGDDYFDEVYLFRPGGSANSAGDLNQANFCEEMGRTTFNDSSNPQPFLNPGSGSYFDWGFQITNISSVGDRMSFDYRYNGEGGAPGPSNFTAHVNSQEHQVELSWNQNASADYYVVRRDGLEISSHLTDTTFVHPFTEADNGYHTYSVLSSSGGVLNYYSAESETWVILGNNETISLEINSNSPYGTKGGELEVSFSNPDMKVQYYTIYVGDLKKDELQVPANTEVTFKWIPGFDPTGEGIHVAASHRSNGGESEIFNIDNPTEGILATYTVTDQGMGVTPPRKIIATTEGSNIRLRWMMATEFSNFNIYRDGVLLASDVTGYEYLDDQLIHSGTHVYQVEGASPSYTTWHPENATQATALCYFCEPPRNLQGIHYPDRNELTWEAPQFAGYGLLAYDNNVYLGQMGAKSFKWGIKINPELLQTFEGQPLSHLEMYDCSAGNYKYKIYNGDAINNANLIYTQQQEMTGSKQLVRFPLNEAVSYDSSKPLWIAVESSGAEEPAPYGTYVGEPNSCLAKIGSSWHPAVNYDYPYTWLLRAYTSPKDTNPQFTYNVYCGPKDGATEEMTTAFENLAACTVNHTSPVDVKYCVTALWNGKETEFSNTVSLSSTGLQDYNDDTESFQATAYQIIDMMGRMVSQGAVSQDIPTGNLSPGIYVLRLYNGNDVKTKKIVIREK